MQKPHASLSPRMNLLLIVAWAAGAGLFLFVVEPHAPVALGAVGALLGAIAGMMQHLSFKQASPRFATATSLMDVRRTFTGTSWGKRYIYWLYLSKVVLAATAFVLVRHPLLGVLFGYVAAYFSLMFVREVVTFKDTMFLNRLTAANVTNQAGAA
jgi:hypothetical protein